MARIIENPNMRESKRSNNDNNKQFIGIRLPLERSSNSNGYFESTYLTIDAVKENIKNLVNTRKGERLFHPDMGIGLEDFLFDQIDDSTELLIKENITDSIKNWIPYVTINKVDLDFLLDSNRMNIKIQFFMNQSPSMMESVDIVIN